MEVRRHVRGISTVDIIMCLWKLLLLGWTRTNSSDSDDCKGREDLHKQHHTSSDDDMSDSGISSGEFSLENVCEDSCSPCSAPRPATPAPAPPAPTPPAPALPAPASPASGLPALALPAHDNNRQVNIVV